LEGEGEAGGDIPNIYTDEEALGGHDALVVVICHSEPKTEKFDPIIYLPKS
jgi:hypothetical protein